MSNASAEPAASADFAQVYREHRDAVVAHLRQRVPPADLDDLTQVVFAKAERALPGFRGDASLRTWLLRIATRAALDYVRSRRFREARRTDPLPEIHGIGESAGGRSVEALLTPAEAPRAAVRAEMHSCIRERISRLPPSYREVIQLRDIDELTNAEIAHRLGLSVDAAKIRLYRARQALKELLEIDCEFYTTDERGLGCDRKPGIPAGAERSCSQQRPPLGR